MKNNYEFAGLLALMIVVMAISAGFFQYGTVDYYTVNITSSERVTSGRGESQTSKYLVFTESGKTFENSDSLFHFKWNSSDLHGKLKQGGTYKLKTYGWRIPLFSTYENIVSAEKISH